MGQEVINLLLIVLVGIIIANMVSSAHAGGTASLFCNIQNFWGVSINGMLGQSYQTKSC